MRVTPSHPVVSLLVGLSPRTIPRYLPFIVPLSVLVFGFQTVKSKPGQAVSPGMKDVEGRGEGAEKIEAGEDLGGGGGGGDLKGAGEISSGRSL